MCLNDVWSYIKTLRESWQISPTWAQIYLDTTWQISPAWAQIHLDTNWQISTAWYILTQPDKSAQLDTSGHNLTDQPNLSTDISGHNVTDQPILIHLDTTWQISPAWYIWTKPDRLAQLEHRYIWTQPERSAQIDTSGHNLTDQPRLSTDTSRHKMTDQHSLIHLDTTWQISPVWAQIHLDTTWQISPAWAQTHLEKNWQISPAWYICTQPDRSAQLDTSGHNLTDQPNSRTVTSPSTGNDPFEPHTRGNNAVDRPLYHHRHCVSVTSFNRFNLCLSINHTCIATWYKHRKTDISIPTMQFYVFPFIFHTICSVWWSLQFGPNVLHREAHVR